MFYSTKLTKLQQVLCTIPWLHTFRRLHLFIRLLVTICYFCFHSLRDVTFFLPFSHWKLITAMNFLYSTRNVVNSKAKLKLIACIMCKLIKIRNEFKNLLQLILKPRWISSHETTKNCVSTLQSERLQHVFIDFNEAYLTWLRGKRLRKFYV